MPNKFDVIRMMNIFAVPPNTSKTSRWWEKKFVDESTITSGLLCRMSLIVWGTLILELWDTLISLAMISKQLMAVIPGLMIQRIMIGMSPLDLAVHKMGGMRMTTMNTIMIIAIVIRIWLLSTKDGRIMSLTTWMILVMDIVIYSPFSHLYYSSAIFSPTICLDYIYFRNHSPLGPFTSNTFSKYIS